MRIRKKMVIFLAAVLGAIVVWGGTLYASEWFLDWKIRYLQLKSPGANMPVYEGQQVILECAWSANVVDNSYGWKAPIEWNGFMLVDGITIKSFDAKYPFTGTFYGKPQSQPDPLFGGHDWGGGTATNEFNGVVNAGWTAKGIGPHTAECHIAQSGGYAAEQLVRTSDNTKKISFNVIKPLGVKEEQWPGWPGQTQGSGSQPKVLTKPKPKPEPKPQLAVYSAVPTVEPSCQNLSAILVVKVQIHNQSSVLKPVKGFVSIHEDGGGAYLQSPPVPLSDFDKNQIVTLALPVGVSPVYKSALPGPHKLRVYLKDALENGQPTFDNPYPPFKFSVSFPPGYCQPKAIAPSFPVREKR